MSERNGDRARFQKERQRKLARRRRLRALLAGLRAPANQPKRLLDDAQRS